MVNSTHDPQTLTILDHATDKLQLVVTWHKHAAVSHKDATYMYLSSEQEEADTKMMLHASGAKSKGATKVAILSSDTDVLVLTIRCCPDLCKDTVFETSTGENYRSVPIGPIDDAIGDSKAAALPAFHSITETDVTGRFAGKGNEHVGKHLMTQGYHT